MKTLDERTSREKGKCGLRGEEPPLNGNETGNVESVLYN